MCALHASLLSCFSVIMVLFKASNVMTLFYVELFPAHMHTEDSRSSLSITGKSMHLSFQALLL